MMSRRMTITRLPEKKPKNKPPLYLKGFLIMVKRDAVHHWGQQKGDHHSSFTPERTAGCDQKNREERHQEVVLRMFISTSSAREPQNCLSVLT
jgi:hypothetical protein